MSNPPSTDQVQEMSKRGNDTDQEFWKKIRLGATAVATVGTGMLAAASVLKHQGIGELLRGS